MCNFIMDAHFTDGPAQNTADLVNSASGLRLTARDVEIAGERINNIARAFNVREGCSRADDTFPERILSEPLKAGASKGQYIPREDLDLMLDEYYEARGWTANGIPGREKLRELNLACVAEDLERMGLYEE